MFRDVNRREFLKRAGFGLAAGPFFSSGMTGGFHPFAFAKGDGAKSSGAVPDFEILGNGQVSAQPSVFYGWPTIGITKENQLIVVASAREDHVDPFGRIDLFRSRDGGKSWTWPQTIYDGPLDERDAGLLITSKGSFLVTTFTGSGYSKLVHAQQERLKEGREPEPGEFAITGERFERWLSAYKRLTDEQRKKEDRGCWMLRSTDDGVNWSARYDCQLSSPHGPFETSDGRILFPGRDHSDQAFIRVNQSLDDGVTWDFLAPIPIRSGDDPAQYHELHGVEAADGRLVVQIRNHNLENCNETLQTESADGGKTWSEPHPIGVWGYPSHLIRMTDGNLLMTYSHRRDPVSELARVSTDCGKSWSEPMTIWHIDNMGHDFGYPASVQLPDGSIMSVWYEVIKGTWTAVIRWTHWRLV